MAKGKGGGKPPVGRGTNTPKEVTGAVMPPSKGGGKGKRGKC